MNGCLRNVVFKPRQLTRNTVGPGGQVGRSVAEPGETQHYYTTHHLAEGGAGHLSPCTSCGILPNLASCTAASAGTATSPSTCSCRASSRSCRSCGARGERGTSKNAG